MSIITDPILIEKNSGPILAQEGSGSQILTGEIRTNEFSDLKPEGADFGLLSGMNQQLNRANNQSATDQLGNFLVQIGAEIAGGTIEGIGYLADFQQHAKLIAGTEDEFSNWFSDYGKALKEASQESFPIYEKEIGGFDPSDTGWWFKNGVSIASSLSLLIPARGATGLVSGAGKLLGAERAIIKSAQLFGKEGEALNIAVQAAKQNSKGITAAILSRTMENTMEASGTFQEIYDAKIRDGATEEEARMSAAQGARDVWYQNSAMLLQDLPQYMFMFKAPGLLAAEGKAVQKMFGKASLKDYGKVMLSEGLEEGYQSIVGQEAKASQLQKDFDETRFEERLSNYLKEPELWNSVVFGALGGGLAAVVGRKWNNIQAKDYQIKQDAQLAANAGKTNLVNEVKDASGRKVIVDNLDNLGKVESEIEDIKQEEGVDKQKIDSFLSDVEIAKQVKTSIEGTIDQKYVPLVVDMSVATNQAAKRVQKINSEIDKLKSVPIVAEHLKKNGEGTFEFTLSTTVLKELDGLRNQYKNDSYALKEIDKLEKEYESKLNSLGAKDNNPLPIVGKQLNQLVNDLLRNKVELLSKSTKVDDILKGKTDWVDLKLKESIKEDLSQETNIDKLFQLRDNKDAELSKAAKNRLNQLYKAEDKNVPPTIDELVPFYKNNPLTFRKDLKLYNLPETTTLEEFEKIIKTPNFIESFNSKQQSKQQDEAVKAKEEEIKEIVDPVVNKKELTAEEIFSSDDNLDEKGFPIRSMEEIKESISKTTEKKKLKVDENYQIEKDTIESIGEDRLINGRETTKKVLAIIKKKYNTKTSIGKIIRILEKIIDFNKYAVLKDINGNLRKNAVAQGTSYGSLYSVEAYDGLLNGEERFIKTFIHELIHSFTTSALSEYNIITKNLIPGFKRTLNDKQFNAIENLIKIYEAAKKTHGSGGDYGFTNIDEFLAEAFSNQSFQQLLKNIPSKGKRSNLFKDYLESILDLIHEALLKWSKRFNKPIPNKENTSTILEDIFGWTEDLIEPMGKIDYLGTISELNAKYGITVTETELPITPTEELGVDIEPTYIDIEGKNETSTDELELKEEQELTNPPNRIKTTDAYFYTYNEEKNTFNIPSKGEWNISAEKFDSTYQKGKRAKGYHVLYDKDGQVIFFPRKQEPTLDIDFLRNLAQAGNVYSLPVTLEVDKNYISGNGNWSNSKPLSETNGWKSLKVAIKIQGKTIGFLSDAEKVDGDPLEVAKFEQLRKTIWENTKNSPTDTYTYPVTTNISKFNSPRFWQGPRTKDLLSLQQTDSNGKKLPIILGIAKNGKLFLNNAPLSDTQKEELEGKYNLSDGSVYWLLTNPVTGNYVPYRLFTTKIANAPKAQAKLRELFGSITEQNYKEVLKKVRAIVRWKNNGKYEPDFGYTKAGKFFVVKDGEFNYDITPDQVYDYYVNERGYNIIDDSPLQVEAEKLNQGTYNEAIIKAGFFEANLNAGLFHSPNFKIDISKLVQEEKAPVVKRTIPFMVDKFSLKKKNVKVIKWDEKKETQWFKDKIGELIDFNVVSEEEMSDLIASLKHIHNMDNVEAWGMFTGAATYFLKNNRKGIAAHEAAHVVETLVLSPRQIKSLNKINTEEQRAELFEEYVERAQVDEELLKKSSWYKQLGATIKRLFRKMYLAMKAAVGLNLSQDEIFFRIQSGAYKNNKGFKRNVEAFKPSLKAYSDNLKQQDRLNQVQRWFNEMYLEFKDTKQKEGLTEQEILDMAIKPTLDGTLNTDNIYYKLSEMFRATAKEWTEAGRVVEGQEYEELANKLYDGSIENIKDRFGPMYYNAWDSLKNYGIRVSRLQGDLDINDETQDSLENWMEAKPPAAYESISKQIKMGLAALPRGEFDGDTFVPERDDLYFPRFVNPFEVYSYMKDNLGGALSVEDWMEDLNKMGEEISWAKVLHQILSGARQSTIITDIELFKAQLHQFLQEPKPTFKYLLQQVEDKKKGLYEWRFNNSASKSIATRLATKWIGNIGSPLYNKVVKDGKLEEVSKGLNEYIEKNKDDNTWLFKTMNDLGIIISKEAIEAVTKVGANKRDFLNNLKVVVDNVDKKNFGELMSVRNSLVALAKLVKRYYPEFHLPAFTNVEGETVQNYIRNSFMARQINKFKSAKHRQSTIDKYRQDKFYGENDRIKKEDVGGVEVELRDDSYSLWLDRLQHNRAYEKLEFAVLDGQKMAGQNVGKAYADLSPLEFNRMTLNAFYNNGNYKSGNDAGKSFYSAQIMADSGSHAYIGFESYSQEDIINKLVLMAKNEYYAYLDNLIFANQTGIKGYNPKLMFIPGLIENKNNLTLQEIQEKAIALVQNEERLRLAIKTNLDKIAKETLDEGVKENLIISEQGEYSSPHLDYRIKDIPEFIKDFVYNDFFAQTQIISLFHGKLYQYKSMEDFYKRAKEIWSPGNFIDTSREGVNQKFMTYIVDSGSTVLNYENNKEVVDDIYNNIVKAGFSEDDAKKAASGYGYTDGTNDNTAVTLSDGTVIESGDVDSTDAQGIIDIHRWREIMLGKGMEKNEVERIYGAIINDTYTIDDLTMVMNPIKQFYYTLINVKGQVSGIQIKNSEFVLLPQIAKGNPKLEGILKFLDDSRKKHGVNASINFDSAVKVGIHKVNKSIEELSVDNAIELNNNEYRIQGEVPEHQVDTTNLLGTQLRKLIVGDLDWDDVYEIGDFKDKLTGKELIEEWNQLLIADIEASSAKLNDEFGKDVKFYKMLQDEARSRDYPDKYIEALTLVDGKPRMSLFSPLLTNKSQALIGSTYRNNITKMKFNGMTSPNAMSYGLSKELKILYNADGSIKAFETYLPLWSKSLVENMEEVTVKELEKLELDLGVAYRIPTEGKYSMIPLKIKGFTNAGIMLPHLITKISGLDYDIDKMFVMLYEFVIRNNKPVKVDFYSNPSYKSYVEGIKFSKAARELPDVDNIEELLIEKDLMMTEAEWNKMSPYARNTQKARDNRKLDIIRAVLNNPKTIKSQLTPGGFDDLKAEANRIEKKKGLDLGKINPMTLLSRTKIFSRMMAGKKLIGIPANYNATHALMQHNNLELTQPVLFDGEQGKDLGLLYTLTDKLRLVSNNFAQYLASVVDNGKDPLADKYNLNTYTADVAMLLAKFYPIELGMKFIAQPSIVEFYKEYVNAGGNFKAEEVAILKVLGMSKRDYNKQMENFVPENINTEDLEKGLIENVNSKSQKKFLMHFLYYKNNQAKDLGKLVSAIKVPDAGTSSSIAKTVNNIAKVNDALKLESITGIKEFLNNENLANNSLYEKGVIDAMRKFIDLGFPDYINPKSAFVSIQDKFSNLKGMILGEKEINLINEAAYSFLSNGFDPLKNIDTLKLMKEVPKLWKEFIAKNNKEYYALMGSIDAVPSEHDDSRDKLVLNNNQPKDIENQVINEWENLMASPKPINSQYTEGDLGKMLTEYAFVTNGFRFTTGSLSHIQPITYYENLSDGITDYNTFIAQQIQAANNNKNYLDHFYDQFIRHYFPRLSYVKSYEKEELTIRFDEKTKEPYGAVLNDFQAKEYVKYRDPDSKKWYLFRLESQEENGTAYYERINPLGLYREIEEWNFDITPKNSIFEQNNMSTELEQSSEKFVKINLDTSDSVISFPAEPEVIKSNIILNDEQQEAVDKAIDFIKEGNPSEYFVLEGKAGTGKTTVAEFIAREFKGKNIQIAALSHKAKSVIRSKFIEAGLDKGFGFQSIASLLGQTMDLETGKFEVKKDDRFWKEPPIANADIIIIDEASMVNEQALELIMEGKRRKAKVVFLGDIGQLPPIRTVANDYYKNKTELFGKKSPVFESKNKAKLLERVRQGEESPILPYADYFWENSQVPNPVVNPAKERVTKITPKGSLVFTNTFGNIKDEVLESFKKAVKENKPNHIKVVTYRNATRRGINKLVHDTIFGADSTEFNKGELIIFNSNYTIDPEKILENSFETQIIEAGKINTDSYGVKYQMIEIDAFDTKTEIPVVLSESKKLYQDTISKLFKTAFAQKGSNSYGEALQRAWGYKAKFANIDYGYALTSHKSQGSTYDIVVVDEKDIMGVGPISPKEKSESIYTALTRPRNVAVVISATKVDEILDQSLESLNTMSDVKSIDKFTQDQVDQNINTMSEFINHSGGAKGGDTVWDNVGREFGVDNHNHYRPSDYENAINKKELDVQYLETVKFLGRGTIASNTYAGKLVRRDMIQANKSDAIFGITELIAPKVKGRKGYTNKKSHIIPEGGTGYAVARGILSGKDVYVYNQSSNYGVEQGWYKWVNDNFVKIETPILTKNFAGIGSQEINESGKQAIREVYENTQKSLPIRQESFKKADIIQPTQGQQLDLFDQFKNNFNTTDC